LFSLITRTKFKAPKIQKELAINGRSNKRKIELNIRARGRRREKIEDAKNKFTRSRGSLGYFGGLVYIIKWRRENSRKN